MSEAPRLKMTVDECLVWAGDQPGRHELVDGRIHAMSPQWAAHADAKFAVRTALKRAIGTAGLTCCMVPDGMTVRVDRMTAFEPDALVYCGRRIAPAAGEVPNPLIVVEILSPSTRHDDADAKLIGYFDVSSIRHCLMIDPNRRVVVHHRRHGKAIATRIVGAGEIRLDPPGLHGSVQASLGDPST